MVYFVHHLARSFSETINTCTRSLLQSTVLPVLLLINSLLLIEVLVVQSGVRSQESGVRSQESGPWSGLRLEDSVTQGPVVVHDFDS